MREFLFTLSLILSASVYTIAQSCLPDGLHITTQAQIDNFSSDYPDCVEIEGALSIIDHYNNVYDLSGLSQITSIKGRLFIISCDRIKSLYGLHNIIHIGEDMSISNCDSLNSLHDLGNLQTIQGGIILGRAPIHNLAGLENIQSIGGNFKLFSLDSLTDLTGINNLAYIGGNFELTSFTQSFSLNGCDMLAEIEGDFILDDTEVHIDLSGLNELNGIGGSLNVWNTDQLDLTGLESLSFVGENIHLFSNNYLQDIEGLQGITEIGGMLHIEYNHSLHSLEGLNNIQANTLGNVNIDHNYSLSQCDVESICNVIADPAGLVFISNNANGCNNTMDVANACGVTHPCLPFGDYKLTTQQQIDDFSADYPDCVDLVGNLQIAGSNITDLEGLSQLNKVRGNLIIGRDSFATNQKLFNLQGLNNITVVGGYLGLNQNTTMKNLNGLDMLHSVRGMSVQYNDSLASLDGLKSITSVNGASIIIEYNPILNDIGGIENISPESIAWLSINNNPNLSNCAISSICDYLITSDYDYIKYNAPGCDSAAQILDSCGYYSCPGAVFLSQADIDSFTSLHPDCNLVSGDIIINGDDIDDLSGFINIQSISGSLEISGTSNLIDLTGFDNLVSIFGNLVIGDESKGGNISLETLNGLDQLEIIEGGLFIKNNPNLDHCAIQSICDYLSTNPALTSIFNNGSQCSSEDDVIMECKAGIETWYENDFVIYPNPANDRIYLKSYSGEGFTELRLYSILGAMVKIVSINNEDYIDISFIEDGLYILEIRKNNFAYISKLVVRH